MLFMLFYQTCCQLVFYKISAGSFQPGQLDKIGKKKKKKT